MLTSPFLLSKNNSTLIKHNIFHNLIILTVLSYNHNVSAFWLLVSKMFCFNIYSTTIYKEDQEMGSCWKLCRDIIVHVDLLWISTISSFFSMKSYRDNWSHILSFCILFLFFFPSLWFCTFCFCLLLKNAFRPQHLYLVARNHARNSQGPHFIS